MRKNGYTVIEVLITIAIIGSLVLFIAAAMAGGCGAGDDGSKALEEQGFSDVKIGSRAWFGCGHDDNFNSHFTAKNVNGRQVSGVVCCGFWKGCTVRF